MFISIIIPSYNSIKTLNSLLDSIPINNKDIKEIIIVDSSEKKQQEELDILLKKYNKIIFFKLLEKTIPSIARNIGAEHAKGDCLAFLDSDVYMDKGWVNIVSRLYNDGIKVGGGSVAIPPFQLKNRIALAQYFIQFNEFISSGKQREKDFVPTCNIFCDRNLFFKVGCFPNIRASEDVIFGRKILKENDFLFIPQMKVYHIFNDEHYRLIDNQYMLGKYDAYTNLNYKRLKIILRSVIPLIKYLLILYRVLKTDQKNIYLFILSSPLILSGLRAWTRGYIEGYLNTNE